MLTNNTIESKHPNCIISQCAFLRLNTKLQISLGNPSYRGAGYSCQLLNLSRTFAGLRVAFLAAYHLRYTLDILCCSDSPLPSNRVCLANFAQKIFNRTDRPILVRKLFTNAFSALPFCWRTSLIDTVSSYVKRMFIDKLLCHNDVTLFPHCVSCGVGLLSVILSHYKLLKIFARNSHTCYTQLIIFQRALFTLNVHYSWKT